MTLRIIIRKQQPVWFQTSNTFHTHHSDEEDTVSSITFNKDGLCDDAYS
jgi:hypothetical protein